MNGGAKREAGMSPRPPGGTGEMNGGTEGEAA
jgi:hypothetical protein